MNFIWSCSVSGLVGRSRGHSSVAAAAPRRRRHRRCITRQIKLGKADQPRDNVVDELAINGDHGF